MKTRKSSKSRSRPTRNRERAGARRRGIALIIVLMCSVLFYILISEFIATSRIEERASRNVKFKGEAHYIALGGVNLLKMYLKSDKDLMYDSLADDWAKWGRKGEVKSLPFGSFFVSAVCDAEAGKLNINLLANKTGSNKALYDRTLSRLELLIAAIGYENDFDMEGEYNLAREIADFVDDDDVSWDNSNEPEYYPDQELISLTEILRVEGISPAIFYGYTRDAEADDDADESESEQNKPFGSGTETVVGLIDLLSVYGESSAPLGAGKFNPSFMPRYLIVATLLDYWIWRNATPEELKEATFEEKVAEAKKYADQLIQYRDNYSTKKSDDWDNPGQTVEESGGEEPESNDHPWDWSEAMWGKNKGSGYRGSVLRHNGSYFLARIVLSGAGTTLGKGTLEYRVMLQRKVKNPGGGGGMGGGGGEEEEQEVDAQTLLWMEHRIPEKKTLDELTGNTYLR